MKQWTLNTDLKEFIGAKRVSTEDKSAIEVTHSTRNTPIVPQSDVLAAALTESVTDLYKTHSTD